MNVIRFPKLFNNSSTAVVADDNKITLQSLHLLCSSESETLFGDPEFGVRLRKYFYEQNNYILRDILIDELYTKIITFCPWVFLERKNITITQKDNKLYAQIICKNKDTFETNMFELVLLNLEETEAV